MRLGTSDADVYAGGTTVRNFSSDTDASTIPLQEPYPRIVEEFKSTAR
ncbi:MAG: hypothetical protein QOF30_1013 [Acidimicrobiaceae bacterium]|jgi:hypothetical protein|nr:hypothetical protein [Acidimicrobiaceae bacterium]